MRLTFATVALVSWLGMSGFSDPFWNFLEAFWPSSGTLEKAGATADPDGVAAPAGCGMATPEGCGMDPDGLTGTEPAGGGADPNG